MSQETRLWTILGTIIAIFSAWFTYQQWLLASRPPGQFVQISGEKENQRPTEISKHSSPTTEETPEIKDDNSESLNPKTILGREKILTEWSVSENRDHCGPLGFASVGGSIGVPRRADYLGGWAVAFDLPNQQSAYGIAGTGNLAASAAELELWPYIKKIEVLSEVKKTGLAGYGVSGRSLFSGDGVGQHGLAYVSIEGEGCGYNVWTKLGKTHLELLLENLSQVK
jgi:hypothetical protein